MPPTGNADRRALTGRYNWLPDVIYSAQHHRQSQTDTAALDPSGVRAQDHAIQCAIQRQRFIQEPGTSSPMQMLPTKRRVQPTFQ